MGWKSILVSVIAVFLVLLLFFYWVFPLETIDFTFSPKNSNFSLNSYGNESMQFYENMRYPSKDISYRIQGCTLQKADEMETAFDMIDNLTIINFYSVNNNEEISVTCDSKTRFEGDLFIAGEGGPINITKAGYFNVIQKGAITLIRESKCENPNVGIHELLHALGFDHSENPNNIMYPVSKCSQTIGQDISDMINELYSFQSLPDLAFENVSATMSGRYLDLNFTIRNQGIKDSSGAKVEIYADGELVKEIESEPLDIGHGRSIFISNIFILQKSIDELRFSIKTNFEELDKENNEAILNYKN
ncbi:MAG TPA: matrixin family metalloprotease [Candidatus Nanoarchaeia archaeon]|nr:matrixin family metalloprotease [Candidatus Nanoarchaeia archaeon]